MDLSGKHPSLHVGFDEAARHSYQYEASDPQLHHQGMSVQTLNASCPPYFSQSATEQNNADSFHPLTGFRIASLTQPVSNIFCILDIPVIPVSYIFGYVPENSVESVDDAPPIISSSYHRVQSPLSGNEPGIRGPTPANRLNSDHHLTNLPAELANPQDSRPVAVAKPLNLQQATSDNPVNSTKIVADKSSQAKRRRDIRRQRYRNDPVYAERERERLRKRREDPGYVEREKVRLRERYRNNPTYADQQKMRQRERYQTDPAYAERKRKLQRERRLKDPNAAVRRKERYKNDPVYAEGQKTYNRVYDRMKRKVGKKEAAKLAATARKEYLQSVKCPGDSGDLPQNSTSAETTQNSTSAETTQNADENSDALPSGNEPDISEPASANCLYHLTNLPPNLLTHRILDQLPQPARRG